MIWLDRCPKPKLRSAAWPGLARVLLCGLVFCAALLAEATAAADFVEGEAAYQGGDYPRALAIFSELAERDEVRALRRLVQMYKQGQGVPRDEQKVLQYLTRGAEAGAPDLQQQLGMRYYQGQGVDRDAATAAEWFTRAATQDLDQAQFSLGLMRYRGEQGLRDYQGAEKLFRRAAEQGLPEAQYSLAVLYAFGQGVEQDYQEALRWFDLSAAQGIAAAQYNLGLFHEHAYGVPRNLKTARSWYRQAAEQGLQEAQERLALWDDGVPPEQSPARQPEQPLAQEAVAAAVVPDPGPRPDPPVADPQTMTATPAVRHPPAARHPEDVIRRETWIKEGNAAHYTLQFISALSEAEVLGLIAGHTWQREVGYVRILAKGRIRYNGVYGSFVSRQAAQAAISELPAAIAKNKPWPRTFRELKGLMQAAEP